MPGSCRHSSAAASSAQQALHSECLHPAATQHPPGAERLQRAVGTAPAAVVKLVLKRGGGRREGGHQVERCARGGQLGQQSIACALCKTVYKGPQQQLPPTTLPVGRQRARGATASSASTHLHVVVVVIAALHDVHAALDRRRWQAHMYIAQPWTPAGAARSQRSRQRGSAAARAVKVAGVGHAQQGAVEWQAQQAVQRLAAGQQGLLI